MPKITPHDIWNQLKKDLIGKDSYRGVTFTYAWLANQFGHFSLGFYSTLIIHHFLKCKIPNRPAFWCAIIIAIFWLLFETYNVLGPLLRDNIRNFFSKTKKYVFTPDWWNIAFDTITDLGYFWIGTFSASMLLQSDKSVLYVLFSLIALVIYPSYYWFLTKMYMQSAEYPSQIRLSQWNMAISQSDTKIINEFLAVCKDRNEFSGDPAPAVTFPSHHLLIFGPNKCGKTSLSISVATETSIKHKSSVYTSVMKLFGWFAQDDKKIHFMYYEFWTWRNSNLLIIDDVNPGSPVNDIIDPSFFKKQLMDSPNGEENRRALTSKNVIWVMGNQDEKRETQEAWKLMLIEIGISPHNISTVNLPGSDNVQIP